MYHRDGGKGVALVGTEASEATWPSVSPDGAHRPQPPPHPSGTRRYHRRRGVGAIGSHGEHHGPAAHWEIWMAASALGPLEALRVTSAHGAHFLGVEQDLGTLEAGKLADLLVLNANPLDNIRNTMDILYVMKGRLVYEAETLDEVWPRRGRSQPSSSVSRRALHHKAFTAPQTPPFLPQTRHGRATGSPPLPDSPRRTDSRRGPSRRIPVHDPAVGQRSARLRDPR